MNRTLQPRYTDLRVHERCGFLVERTIGVSRSTGDEINVPQKVGDRYYDFYCGRCNCPVHLGQTVACDGDNIPRWAFWDQERMEESRKGYSEAVAIAAGKLQMKPDSVRADARDQLAAAVREQREAEAARLLEEIEAEDRERGTS